MLKVASACLQIASLFPFLGAMSLQAQGGKELLQWIQEYSPTGYYVINTYETKYNNPGFHKQYISNTTAPFANTPVHESSHMLDAYNNLGTGGSFSYPVGGGKYLKVLPPFKPFLSSEIAVDIPVSLRNAQTDTYIMTGDNSMAVANGIYGLFEEWSAYNTGLKTSLEMSACFKAHFNSAKNWTDYVFDGYWSTAAVTEFRYFVLRYVLYAKKKYPDIYTKILASKETKTIYTAMVKYSEQNLSDWKALMKSQNQDTLTTHGWAEYWLFYNEIQKPEYKDLEKLLLDGVLSIAHHSASVPANPSWIFGPNVQAALFQIGGQQVYATKLDTRSGGYRKLWLDWRQKNYPNTFVLRISHGQDALTLQRNALDLLIR